MGGVLRIGRLRHKVIIEEVTETRDSYGGVTETWGTFAITKASVEPLAGREYFAAKQDQAETTHKIRMRYIPGIGAKMRVRFGVRVFDVLQPLNIEERNKELLLMAKEAL